MKKMILTVITGMAFCAVGIYTPNALFAQEHVGESAKNEGRVLAVLDRYDQNQDGRIDDYELQFARDRRDKAEDVWDRREDFRDRSEDISDRREDVRDG